MPLLLLWLLLISVSQLGTVLLSIKLIEMFNPEDLANINFDPVTVFYGNLQIIAIIFVYNFIKKYIRV